MEGLELPKFSMSWHLHTYTNRGRDKEHRVQITDSSVLKKTEPKKQEVSYKCLMYRRNESEYIFNKTRKARLPRSESKENKLKTKMTALQMAAQIGGRENTSEN